jgi:hypothetical protein
LWDCSWNRHEKEVFLNEKRKVVCCGYVDGEELVYDKEPETIRG